MLRAGRLRHRVTLQTKSETTDSFGQRTEIWSDVGTFWAEVRPLRGKEAEVARQIRAEVTHKVTFRSPAAITPRGRLVFEARRFNIIEVIDVNERGALLEVMASEVLDGAPA